LRPDLVYGFWVQPAYRIGDEEFADISLNIISLGA
jgi:hypothetical protein